MASIKTILLLSAVLFASCRTRPDYLEKALQQAGKNRVELEKVLAHYKRQPADSLKLRAAIFLIENMPGHYSYADDGIGKYYSRADSILDLDLPVLEKKSRLEKLAQNYPGLNSSLREDIHFITAEYLIDNIEKAFDAWKNKPWARHISFDDFCEYLLPYKCTELQQPDYWRDTLGGKYNTEIEYLSHVDEARNSIYDAARALQMDLRSVFQLYLLPSSDPFTGYPFLSAGNMYKLPFGYCSDYALLTTAVLRSHGIPVCMDYVRHRGSVHGGHQWNVITTKFGQEVAYDGILGACPEDHFQVIGNKPYPKVFRKTYSINRDILKYREEAQYVDTYLGNVFQRDVTDHYGKTSDLEIPVFDRSAVRDKYVYLSVFGSGRWNVAALGLLHGNKATYTNVGRDVVYLPVGYNGSMLQPVAYPLILKTDGSLVRMEPDTTCQSQVRLTRKYRKTYHVAAMERKLVKGKIQASNRKDFIGAQTIYQVDTIWTPYKIRIENTKLYRYWRYISEELNYPFSNIAELMFWRENDTLPFRGRIIGTDSSGENNTKEKAFDGDPLTHFDAAVISGGWVGYDFGKPVNFDYLTCLPRSDGNAIEPGDEYELKYWRRHGWVSMGKQIAKDNVLYFDGVPSNAVLWLSDLTKGTEERIFTYENGKQVFW